MPEFDAHRTWLAYRGVEAFAFAVGWTVAPVFFVRDLDFSPLQLVLAGTALETVSDTNVQDRAAITVG